MMEETTMSASPSQRRAITFGEGPALVLAGPGSGKTLVITYRIQYLIQKCNISPERILVITFSKAAALEMQERFRRLSRETGCMHASVVFGTFHAVFFQILKYAYHLNASNIIREDQKNALLSRLAEEAGIDPAQDKDQFGSLASEISYVRNEQIPIGNYYSTTCNEEAFRKIYQGYLRELGKMGWIDFDDMLLLCYELFTQRKDILRSWQQKFQYILTDEFQDINRIQYEILKLLAAPENNLFAVGDDDQSIYRFRGARPEIMLGFPKDFANAAILQLEENYRCHPQIIRSSLNVIGANTKRFPKNIRSAGETKRLDQGRGKADEENHVCILEHASLSAQAEWIARQIRKSALAGVPYHEMAVLTRTKNEGRYFAGKFLRYEIPFVMAEMTSSLADHWITQDVLSYFRIACEKPRRKDFLRVMNHPLRYFSRSCVDQEQVSFDRLRWWYDDKPWMLERIDLLEEDLGYLGRMRPFAAINFLRKSMDYDHFLRSYAVEKEIDGEELVQVMEEIQESAAAFVCWQDWEKALQAEKEEMQERSVKRAGAHNTVQDAVILATLHASKGLEYDDVYLPGLNEGILPWRKARKLPEIEEERRLFYVGMTRARKRLYISWVKERFGRRMKRSSFLEPLLYPSGHRKA